MLFGVGVLFSLALVLIFDDVHRTNHRLVTQGVRGTGVITALDPGGYRRTAWIRVSYAAGQRRLTAEIRLGSEVDRYAVGQKVDVYYDRERPTRMTIAGVVNQSARSTVREVPAAITMDSRSRVVAEVDEPPSPAVFRSPSIALVLGPLGPKQGVWTTGYLWIAGPMGRRAVLALPGGGDVLPLRSPRTATQRRRWTS
ncbi:MAG TPA: DUF3592 domain-containing protein [Actinoallomurus sp.]|nr:DUF3592 domain-containing protein [Actinoallomurus sp.]